MIFSENRCTLFRIMRSVAFDLRLRPAIFEASDIPAGRKPSQGPVEQRFRPSHA
jgi:hypothetical protein